MDCGLHGQSMGGWGEGLHPSDVGTMETGMAVSPAPGTVPSLISVREMISHLVFILYQTDGSEGHSLFLLLASLL